MFGLILKKELRSFFSGKGNLTVMVILPILLITIFGLALGNYMKAQYRTFHEGVVLYRQETENTAVLADFQRVVKRIEQATGVSFEAAPVGSDAKQLVETSKAFALITVKENGYDYFRSTFNETEGGKIVRNLFTQIVNGHSTEKTMPVERQIIPAQPMKSSDYYAFSGLSFSILFMGLLVGFSVHREKSLDTIKRIYLSKAGIARILIAKIITGVFCGIGQILVTLVFSSLVFHVSWEPLIFRTVLLFTLLALYSAIFGALFGLICRTKAMCQNIILMVTMLSGYLGGSITPLYLLENKTIMGILVNLSPLYWLNRAVWDLRNNLVGRSSLNAIMVLTGLVVLFSLGLAIRSKSYLGVRKGQVSGK